MFRADDAERRATAGVNRVWVPAGGDVMPAAPLMALKACAASRSIFRPAIREVDRSRRQYCRRLTAGLVPVLRILGAVAEVDGGVPAVMVCTLDA
jgi:hypothetical protein